MTAFVTAGAGFLAAVLWFDLMHDVQVLGVHDPKRAEPALRSIATYYRRVTTDARPMNRLIALVMLATVGTLAAQLAVGSTARWISATCLALAASATGLAGARTVGNARRLGADSDGPATQLGLARSVLADHLYCLAAIALVLILELALGR